MRFEEARLTALESCTLPEGDPGAPLSHLRAVATEQQRLLDMAERMSGVGHWRYRADSGHVTWSDEVYRIHGVTRDSFDPAYSEAVDFYEGADRERVNQAVLQTLSSGQGFQLEARLRRPDGALRNVLCKAECILGDLGEVIGLCGVFQDVTEQRQALLGLEQEIIRRQALEAAEAKALARAEILLKRADFAEQVAGLGHWRVDAETLAIVWSDQMYQIYGVEPGSHIDVDTVQSLYHPDDADLNAARVAQIMAWQPSSNIVTRILRRDGTVRWLRYNSQPEYGPVGEVLAMVGTVHDITDQRSAETALAESEAKYRALAENSTDILVRFGPDGLIRYISPSCRALGLDPAEEVGQSIGKLIASDHQDRIAPTLAALFSGAEIDRNAVRQHRLIDPSGREVWLEGNPSQVRDAAGQVVEVVTVLRDVSTRHEIEQALAASERRFRSLSDNAPDMISEMRLDGTLTYVSPASLAIIGFTPEEMLGRTPFSFMHPDDAARVLKMCETVFASKGAVEPWAVEYRAYDKSGREVWMESKPTFVCDPASGHFTGINDVMRDITSRKVLEVRLRQAQAEAEDAAAAKGEFLANMSHELRTPLTSIIGFTRLAAEQSELAPLTRTYVERVEDASRALLCTVNDILDFSKLEAGQVGIQPEPVSLARLTRATLELFTPQAGAKDLTLTLDGEADDLVISLDPDRVRQILLNLVGNAVKFTSAGGVTLRSRYDLATSSLRIEVIDTGDGIPEEKQDRLFKRFSQVDGSLQRAQGGTGLGLAICKGLAEAMGGEIGVDSVPGQGSRFWFRVPAPLTRANDAAETGVQIEQPTFGGVRVLVVDDHPLNRELARLFLAGVGAEVTEACDGEEAVQLASEWPFDVILMDIRMPRLDGPGALRRIRETSGPNDATPILAFTADADAEIGARLQALGFEDVVAKPLEPGALIGAVARATDFTPQPWSAANAG